MFLSGNRAKTSSKFGRMFKEADMKCYSYADDLLATQYVPSSFLSIEFFYHITLNDKTKIIDRVLRNFCKCGKRYVYIGPT